MAYTIESLLAMLPGSFQASAAQGVDTSVQLSVSGSEAGEWNAVIKDSKLTVTKGVHAAPEVTLSADSADILAIANGKLDPTQALMMGKIKAKGNMAEAMSLIKLFKPN